MVEEDIEFVTFDGDIISKSDLREELIDRYIQAKLDGLTKITDFTIGSEAYHLCDLIANLRLESIEEVDGNYRNIMPHTADGEFLDNYGDMAGVHRIGASPSTGNVTFTRLSSNLSSEIIIPDGSVVSTDDAISFIVDAGEDIIIPAGETTATVNVICEQEGAYTNVEPNTITLVMGALGNMVKVTNPEPMMDGEDTEEDDDYRARILLSPDSVPCGTLGWYEKLCLELESVHDVSVRKGTIQSEPDIIITFAPSDWESTVVRADINDYNEDNDIESTITNVMTSARADLVDNFLLDEYNAAGIKIGYHLAEKQHVLVSNNNVTYLIGVLPKDDYLLDDLKPLIIEKVNMFNSNALVGNECSPHTLCSIIEEEVQGINDVRIIKRTGSNDNYTFEEVVNNIIVDTTQIYEIDTTNIDNRIVELTFSLGLNVG